MKKLILVQLLFSSIIFFSCSNEEDLTDNSPAIPQFTIETGLQTIVSQDLKREYLLRVPSSYKKDSDMPLVVVLHGRTGTGTSAEKRSKFTELGEQEGFITVYPTALKDLLQNVSTWTSESSRNIGAKNYDDINYIKDLIDYLKSNLNIDNKRIYLTGFSNGAFMTYKFAFKEGNMFAAIAPVSGFSKRLRLSSAPKKGPVSLLHIHGMKDPILPVDGEGIPSRFFNAEEVIDYYIENY